MKVSFNRYLALFLVFIICIQFTVGCSLISKTKESSSTLISEHAIKEVLIYEKYINQGKTTEEYIVENLLYEDEIYEYKINEDIISEAYIIKVIAGETTEEEILAQLPEDIEEYDIDWVKVISRFAVGTTIIIAVGVVNHVYGGSTYFVFGSPATVAKDALIGGAMGAAINEVINSIKDGKPTHKAIKKYAIEGFAEGYMWGAITSVLKVASKNFKMPKSLKFSDGKSVKIAVDGSVVDDTGAVWKAYNQKDGIFLKMDGTKENIVRLFDSSGKELVKATTDDLTTIAVNILPPNTNFKLGTDKAAKIYKTDDVGQIFRVDNELLPNTYYELNGYNYTTDDLGRIIKADFKKLKLKSEYRLGFADIMDDIGKGFNKTRDQRGHLIADRFGGDNSLANLVPMDENINLSEYKIIENLWAKSINEGKNVSGTIKMNYTGKSFRPKNFDISYDVGERLVNKLIQNGL